MIKLSTDIILLILGLYLLLIFTRTLVWISDQLKNQYPAFTPLHSFLQKFYQGVTTAFSSTAKSSGRILYKIPPTNSQDDDAALARLGIPKYHDLKWTWIWIGIIIATIASCIILTMSLA